MNENKIPRTGDTGDSVEANNDKINEPLLTEKIARTLAEKFPAAFAKRGVPLAIGIHAALAVALPEFTPAQLSAFLGSWCSDLRYLRKIRAGKPRVDLQGRPAGEITIEEESYAKWRAQEVFFAKMRGRNR